MQDFKRTIGPTKSSGTMETSFLIFHVSLNFDFEHTVRTIDEQALIFKQANEFLSFDPDRTIPRIQSLTVKSSGTDSVPFNCRVLLGSK